MKKLLSALFVLALCSSVAFATVPDPAQCDVVPGDALNGLVIAPDSPSPIPATVYTVTVRNSSGDPIPSADVSIEFGAGISICNTAVHNVPADGNGVAIVTLRGGGCLNGIANAGVVKANGVPIRNYNNVKSPDFDGAAGDGIVNVVDLVFYKSGDLCHDYDNSGFVNVVDLVIFAGAYLPQHSCTLQ
jgi:hypothetical protein